MINLLNKIIFLKKKKFVQDTAILQVGSLFSTGLSLLASIIYARVLGIEGYANYALIFAFVGITSFFLNVGADQATLTLLSKAYSQKRKDQVKDILTYYIKITLLVSLIVGILIIIISPFLTTRLYNSYEIGQLARVIIVSNIIKIFWGMYIVVLQVIRKIKNLTIIENLNKIFYVLIPAGLVLLGLSLKGLVFGYLIVAFGFAIFSILAYRKLRFKNLILPSWREIFYNLKDVKLRYYFKFGFLIAIDKNLSNLYSTLPIFILGIFYLNEVAFFKIAVAYAGLPLILAGSVSRLLTVQLPKSKLYGLEILKRDFIRSAIGSFLIVLIISVIFAFLASILIPLAYGREYLSAIMLSYPLLAASIIVSLGVGLGPILRTLNLMKASILLNFILIAIGSCILYYFIKNYPIQITIYPIAFFPPLAASTLFIYIIRYLNKKIKNHKNTKN